ncbi:helix-turn-helix domain-containing protein [Flavobacterium sp.]|uniref:helix-turn-helix domain-containing protein n=1 Tax=Flavobacterium sp. TaxID=239 RepID=UPI00262B7637|nr:helix-turn-helix transcriptional regulator [Flavobacterium sp.]
MDTVGYKIRESRKSKGLLLRQLSASLDMDVAILSKIERGERTPTKQQLIKIAKSLAIDEKELINTLLAESILNELSSNENPIEVLKIVQKELKKSNN